MGQQQPRSYSNLYSPDSVSAVNRPASGTYNTDSGSTSSMSMSTSDYSNDLYNLQPPPPQPQPPPQNFSYHGHYNAMEYTNGGQSGAGGQMYMMYSSQGQQMSQGTRGYPHHPSDMSNYAPHSEGGSVKDELDQLSVATGDLDEGLSETGTP